MRIQNNIMAMNAHRSLTGNTSATAKSLEKLSSGLRINRAGDDAAGLAISEKMRAQIKGLEVAQKNANDGISMIQTAEGALTEVHSMLNRMVELATQSANGTYDDSVDRPALQAEVNSLSEEIDRIAKTTNYNRINLLDGSLGAAKTGSADYTIATLNGANGLMAGASKAVVTNVTTVDVKDGYKVGIDTASSTGTKLAFKVEDSTTFSSTTVIIDLAQAVTRKDGKDLATNALAAGDQAVIDLTAAGLGKIELTATDANATVANLVTDLKTLFGAGTATMKDGTTKAMSFTAAAGGGMGGALTLQVGDTAEEAQKVTVKIGSMTSQALGISGLDITSSGAASSAITKLKDAINTVSSQRADLGAVQNRLEHTINNLGVASENITAAESRIRDTDMAKEMMNYTKYNVLTQAAQAMLAQANQQPQGVLQLLR